MSGIGPRLWWQGRGGIIDPRRRIVPYTQAFVAPAFPGEGNPSEAAALGLWAIHNAYERASFNVFTPGGLYTAMNDVSGNGRDMDEVLGSSAPNASGLVYPGKLGLTSVPQATGGRRLRYLMATANLQSFSWFVAGPWQTPINNSGSPFQLLFGGSGTLVEFQWGGGSYNINWSGFAGTIGPSFAGPSNGTGTDAYRLLAMRCEVDGLTANWRATVAYDEGTGSGIQFNDQTFSETATLDPGENTSVRRGSWRGIKNEGNGEKGVSVVYTTAVSDTVYDEACITAGAQIGANVANAIAEELA